MYTQTSQCQLVISFWQSSTVHESECIDLKGHASHKAFRQSGLCMVTWHDLFYWRQKPYTDRLLSINLGEHHK